MKGGKGVARPALLLLCAFVSGVACAQTSNGTLVGSVVDPAGALEAKADVSAVSSQYGLPHETHTDSVGTYRMESLQPGIYAVTFKAPSFEALTVTGVVIN